MRQPYFILLSLFASFPSLALTFQTRLENIEWKVEGDKFECRLIQPITDFGSGVFVRRAGEQAVFRLNAYNSVLGEGDILGNAAQIDTLLSTGYSGYLSFEPFAESVHALADIQQALGASIAHLQKR